MATTFYKHLARLQALPKEDRQPFDFWSWYRKNYTPPTDGCARPFAWHLAQTKEQAYERKLKEARLAQWRAENSPRIVVVDREAERKQAQRRTEDRIANLRLKRLDGMVKELAQSPEGVALQAQDNVQTALESAEQVTQRWQQERAQGIAEARRQLNQRSRW